MTRTASTYDPSKLNPADRAKRETGAKIIFQSLTVDHPAFSMSKAYEIYDKIQQAHLSEKEGK